MGENTKIEWAHHTFNPWIGCTKVSPGCKNCYAETLMDTRYGRVKWGKGNPRQQTSATNWKLPLRWNKEAQEKGIRYRVFCASLADWLDDEIPIEWLVDLLDLIRHTASLDWLLLTKRPENWKIRLERAFDYAVDNELNELCCWIDDWVLLKKPPANCWIGTSVEDQLRADERIEFLLKIPGKICFLSCEPLLGPVDLRNYLQSYEVCANCGDGSWFEGRRTCCEEPLPVETPSINWVICGGESGLYARPMHLDWARALRDQCKAASVPFFFKQWGAWGPWSFDPDWSPTGFEVHWCDKHEKSEALYRAGKSRTGREIDGREWNEMPS